MKIKVAVLRGGPSYAYDDSLKTGAFVLSHLRDREDYEPIDVFISRDGDWHHFGLVESPHKILSCADVVFNTLRGPYGEDGGVQHILETLNMPFVGSQTFASGVSHNKALTKDIYIRHSLPTPRFMVIGPEDFESEKKFVHVYRNFMLPVMVKPVTGARGMGLRLARTINDVKDAVKKVFEHSPKAIIEEYISGTSAHCVVLENAKGEKLYSFIPVHISTKRNTASPSVAENKKIESFAKRAHEALGLRHFSSSDFIITPRGKIYILETNSVPTLFEGSVLHKSLEQTGWQPKDFVDHTIKLALNNF